MSFCFGRFYRVVGYTETIKIVKTAILYDLWFPSWGTGCLRDAEHEKFGGSSRRAVGGFAEVWDRDVHVEDNKLSIFAKFDDNPTNRLRVRGDFVIIKTGGSKLANWVSCFLVENRRGLSDRDENAGAVAKYHEELPEKFSVNSDQAFGSCRRGCASVITSWRRCFWLARFAGFWRKSAQWLLLLSGVMSW